MGTYCVRAIGLFQAGPAKSKNLKNVLCFFFQPPHTISSSKLKALIVPVESPNICLVIYKTPETSGTLLIQNICSNHLHLFVFPISAVLP